MKKTTNKGFTLIELLAVIVILAIIALIAVPVIINIIDKANKSAFKDTAYGVIDAGKYYFEERFLDQQTMTEDVTISLPDTTNTLALKGAVPEGSITISKEGKIALAVSNGRYCITKGFDDKDVTITEDIVNCKNPAEPEPIMTSTNTCIQSGNTCNKDDIKAGILVNVKVNDSQNYDFYVISDTGNEVILIMDRNLGNNVRWYADAADNSHGPTTAVAELKTRTSGWINIPEREYTYSDDGRGNKYTVFKETMRVRMLTYTEATTMLGCSSSTKSCPSWLYINLKDTGDNSTYGYWTSAASASNSNYAHYIYYQGGLNNYNTTTSYGLRPVIILSKSL